ncbi:MAG: hypothetical protein K9G76_07655 [Bacteroidales bacterium]|nr:hypothetical protein [Bacteroidales bacterium]MCF8405454.1 hypothetical protein [Bacteroidales bacterium]
MVVFRLFIPIIIFSFIFNTLSSQTVSEYNRVLDKGNEYYTKGDLINAKASYEYALRIRPEEEIPKEKLDEVMIKLREKMTHMDQYTRVISEADELFRKEEFELAIKKYQEASSIIESEGYPEEKIREIEGKKDESRANQIAYEDAIYRAEKYLKYSKYEKALEEYDKALQAIPDDPTVLERIAELRVEKVELEKNMEIYDEIVMNADRLLMLKYYREAKEEYQKASEARPDEEYPRMKITEVDNLLIKRGEYERLIDSADEFYSSKNLDEAKIRYQQALTLYPYENYPKDMLSKTNAALIELKGADVIYNEAVKAADAFLAKRDYSNAIKEYENASSIKPVERYPIKKIAEINMIREEMENAELSYNMALKRGEQYIAANDFENAKIEFEKANTLKPKEKLPIEKLSQVEKSLLAQNEVMQSFNQSMDRGVALMQNAEYDKARVEFENALVILPNNKSAKEKLNEIKAHFEEEKKKAKQYQEFIVNGDAFFADGDFDKARNNYVKALTIDASDPYPADKITEIDTQLKITVEQQKEFEKSIATGDIYFGNEEYENAKDAYEKALSIKPGAKYANDKIKEIESLLKNEADGDEEAYAAAIKEADGLFALQNYAEAKLLYIKASNLKPKEGYPKEKIKEIEGLLNDIAARQAEYNQLMAAADRMLESGETDKAKEKYEQASEIYPNEQAPRDKLKEIALLVVNNEISVQNAYNDLIFEADVLFSNQKYDEAKVKYQKALKLKPGEGHPTQRLEEMKGLSQTLEKEEDHYSRLIAEADRLFTSKEYQQAKEKYMEASLMFPAEEHPKNRIEEINLLNRKANQNNQQAYDKAIADADKFFAAAEYSNALDSYRQALEMEPDENHPLQMIEKINKILSDNAMRKILNSSVNIQNNDEEKFSFEPLAPEDRKGSVLLISARGIASRSFKVFVNFGKGGSKNGGYILPVTPSDSAEEFIIPLGKQNKWFTEDNNWFKLIPQGGSIEVTRIEIVKE